MIHYLALRDKIRKSGDFEKAGLLRHRKLASLPMLAAALLWALGLPSAVLGQTGADAISKLDHLLQAAAHLEQAGRTDWAAEIYAQLAAEPQADRQRLADAKLEQIRQLEADVARLRTSSPAGEQVLVQLKVIELSLDKLHASGLSLVSIRNLLDSHAGSAVLDEDGRISGFIELLSREGLVQVVAEPKLVTVDGRPATVQVGELSAPDRRVDPLRANHPAVNSTGLRFTCTPKIADSGKLSLDLHFLRQVAADTTKTGEQARDLRSAGSLEVSTHVELRSGDTLVLAGPRQAAGAKGSNAALLLMTATILETHAPLPAP